MDVEKEIVVEAWDESLEPVSMTRVPEEFRTYEIVQDSEARAKLVRPLLFPLVAVGLTILNLVRSTSCDCSNSLRRQTSRRGRSRRRSSQEEHQGRGDLRSRRGTRFGRGGRVVQYGGRDVEDSLHLGGQVSTEEAEVFQQGPHGIRVEQIQPDALRVSSSSPSGPRFLTEDFLLFSTDNPPPKVVQGYKFNVFYPDLIDKSSAPYVPPRLPSLTSTYLLFSDRTSSSRRRATTIPARYSLPAEHRTRISPSPSSTDPGVRPTSLVSMSCSI